MIAAGRHYKARYTHMDELEPGQNTGVIVADNPLQWKAGAETGTAFRAVLPDGDWRPFMSNGERQTAVVSGRNLLETNACMTFAALDSLEGFMNRDMASGAMPERHRDFLQQNGFLGPDGKLNYSDRFTAKMSGTTHDGNSFDGVYGSIRNHGLIPEAAWAFPVERIAQLSTEPQRWAEYYAEIPQALKDQAKNWLKYFQVNYDLVRYPSSTGNIAPWLQYSPLHILTGVCPPWNTAETIKACSLPVQHGTAMTHVGATQDILDHYVPFEKHFALDYPIPYAVRVTVTYLTPNEAPAPFVYDYQTNLRYGAPDNAAVHAMQKGLQTAKNSSSKPYMTVGLFGPYGPQTKAALGAFQTDHGIKDPDGQGMNFGPQTRAALTAVLKNGGVVSTPNTFEGTESAIIDGGPNKAGPTMTQSKQFTINGTDVWKTVRGALITLAAVALAPVVAYIGANYLNWSYNVCIADYPCFDTTFIAIPVIGALLELARRWLVGQGSK